MSFKNQEIKDVVTKNVILSLARRIEILESKVQDLIKDKRIEDERRFVESHKEDQME